jgi:hypothetical protein
VSDLEATLAGLSSHVEWPETPDLAARVRARLDETPAPVALRPRRSAFRPRLRPRLRVAAVLLVVLLVAGTLAVLPGPRAAIAGFLGIGPVRITRDPGAVLPPAVPSQLGEGLGLGRRVTVGQALAATGRPVPVPARLGAPDAVWLDETVPGGAVTIVYRPRPGLPADGPTGLGLLLTQLPGRIERAIYLKKVASAGTTVREVRVGTAAGLWIEGDLHGLFYVGRDLTDREEPNRLAGNTLLWERDGLVYRVEAQTSADAALAIAASLP